MKIGTLVIVEPPPTPLSEWILACFQLSSGLFILMSIVHGESLMPKSADYSENETSIYTD